MAVEKIIRFKSEPVYFDKEKSGCKNNTIRRWERWDSRFSDLDYFEHGDNMYIEIENKDTGEVFSRKIRDVTKFLDEYMLFYIITWEV